MHSLYKRAVDLEAGGTDVGLLEDDSASASSITEELSHAQELLRLPRYLHLESV